MPTKQPNSRNCFICGLENSIGLKLKFYETGPGEVIVDHIVPDEYQGYPGVVHGGVVAAMLDEVAGRTQMNGSPPRFMYTARLDIRYRQNVPTGQPLHLIGRSKKVKQRTATASAQIFGPDGSLLAEAEALLINIPDDLISTVDLESLGWKVYPD